MLNPCQDLALPALLLCPHWILDRRNSDLPVICLLASFIAPKLLPWAQQLGAVTFTNQTGSLVVTKRFLKARASGAFGICSAWRIPGTGEAKAFPGIK